MIHQLYIPLMDNIMPTTITANDRGEMQFEFHTQEGYSLESGNWTLLFIRNQILEGLSSSRMFELEALRLVLEEEEAREMKEQSGMEMSVNTFINYLSPYLTGAPTAVTPTAVTPTAVSNTSSATSTTFKMRPSSGSSAFGLQNQQQDADHQLLSPIPIMRRDHVLFSSPLPPHPGGDRTAQPCSTYAPSFLQSTTKLPHHNSQSTSLLRSVPNGSSHNWMEKEIKISGGIFLLDPSDAITHYFPPNFDVTGDAIGCGWDFGGVNEIVKGVKLEIVTRVLERGFDESLLKAPREDDDGVHGGLGCGAFWNVQREEEQYVGLLKAFMMVMQEEDTVAVEEEEEEEDDEEEHVVVDGCLMTESFVFTAAIARANSTRSSKGLSIPSSLDQGSVPSTLARSSSMSAVLIPETKIAKVWDKGSEKFYFFDVVRGGVSWTNPFKKGKGGGGEERERLLEEEV